MCLNVFCAEHDYFRVLSVRSVINANFLFSRTPILLQGTKSTILSEASNYIRLLQQQHNRLELDKQQLVQEVQRIGGVMLQKLPSPSWGAFWVIVVSYLRR